MDQAEGLVSMGEEVQKLRAALAEAQATIQRQADSLKAMAANSRSLMKLNDQLAAQERGALAEIPEQLAKAEERERRLREALEQTDCFCHTEFTCGRCAALDAAKESHE